jgi:hypothetical protein
MHEPALNQLAGTPVLRSLGVVEGCFQRRMAAFVTGSGFDYCL